MPVVSSDDIIKALKKGGFEYAPKRGKGSHMALYKIDENGRKLLVIVPKRRELPKGTLLSILQQANLSKDDFIELLKK
ncbi:MAG: type II toxin-antitoxin system HicA family toxin [Methanomicrobia archaeon]|nr:type II toxin-antitoxin system HicA family toxin [Methanomicrobia archaeon]